MRTLSLPSPHERPSSASPPGAMLVKGLDQAPETSSGHQAPLPVPYQLCLCSDKGQGSGGPGSVTVPAADQPEELWASLWQLGCCFLM